MKKKAGIIATSVAAIAVCSSLIAGSTFALFTSESEVNVAVNAARVKLNAAVVTGAATSTLGGAALGGFSDVDGLKIENIAPEDEYTFTVNVTNTSTIKTLYRTKIEFSDTELASALTVTVNDVKYEGIKSLTMPWKELGAKQNPEDLSVKVSFFDGEKVNELQGKGTDIKVIVEGVQGNAGYEVEGEPTFVKIPEGKVHTVADNTEFTEALNDVAVNGGTVELAENVEFETETRLNIDKDVLIDLNGKDMNLTATETGNALAVQSGASVTMTGGNVNVAVFKNYEGGYTNNSGIRVENSALILDHVTLETSSYGIFTGGKASEVIVRDSVLTCNDVLGACIATNAGNKGEERGISVVVENSTLNSVGAGILVNVPGPDAEDGTEDYSLKMSGTTVNGGLQGVIVRGGKARIENCTLNAGLERYFEKAMKEVLALNKAYKGAYNFIVTGSGNWTTGNDVPLAALVAGNNRPNNYMYPTTVELVNVKTNVPASLEYDGKSYEFYTVFANGNTAETKATVTFDQNCKIGAYVTGNEFADIKPMD